eukprot:g24431.t1
MLSISPIAPLYLAPVIKEKLNMTTIFEEEDGNVKTVPATILCVKKGGNMVTDKRWPEKHGHYSVQVGYERYEPNKYERSGKRALQIQRLARNECPPLRKIKDFRVRPQDWEKWEVGQKIWPSDLFKEGDIVDIHGWAKGKGFAGRIKRWGGKRGPMGHGSKHHRTEGSIGAARPKRVEVESPHFQAFEHFGGVWGCQRAKHSAHSFLTVSFKKYMYEADEGPIEPPLLPRGPVVDQQGRVTGTTMERYQSTKHQLTCLQRCQDLERVPLGAQAPLSDNAPPKGPTRFFRSDGPVDAKMDEEAEQAEEELEGDLEAKLLERLEALLLEDPSTGYRKLHDKLKGEEDFKEVSLKKVVQAWFSQQESSSLCSYGPSTLMVTGAISHWIDALALLKRSLESSKGPLLYSVSDDGTLREWSSSGELLRSFNTAEGAQCVQVTDDFIIAGDSSGLMRLWSRSSGEIFKDVKVATRYVKSLLLCGEYVFTGDYGNLVQQWHLATGELKAQFRGHKAGVICLALQGDHLVAGGGDGRVLLFDRSKATPNEEGLAVSEAVECIYKAQGFVCSLEICEDRLLVPDRDEDKVASIRLFSNTGELVPDNIRDVRSGCWEMSEDPIRQNRHPFAPLEVFFTFTEGSEGGIRSTRFFSR